MFFQGNMAVHAVPGCICTAIWWHEKTLKQGPAYTGRAACMWEDLAWTVLPVRLQPSFSRASPSWCKCLDWKFILIKKRNLLLPHFFTVLVFNKYFNNSLVSLIFVAECWLPQNHSAANVLRSSSKKADVGEAYSFLQCSRVYCWYSARFQERFHL